jgi:hypothetical protein
MSQQTLHLAAAITAIVSGWAVIRLARAMSFHGVGLEDGGGYTALLIAALTINLAAVTVALS